MPALADRLAMTLKDDQNFQRELRALLISRGYAEADAAAALELLLRGMRRGPVDSGLNTQSDQAH